MDETAGRPRPAGETAGRPRPAGETAGRPRPTDETLRWPPPGDELTGTALPAPATAVYRVGVAQAVIVVLLPFLLTLQAGRLVRAGMPASRLLNPGVLVVVVLATAAVAAAVMPARRRVTVAAGTGWVARRAVVGGRWRVVRLADEATYSLHPHRVRGGRVVVVAMLERSGRRTAVGMPAGNPASDALAAALAAAGAQPSERELRTMGPGRIVALVALIIAIGVLPMVLLEIGAFRLLPAGIAGEFSSSGCRAALAAENQSGRANPRVVLTAQETVGSSVWSLRGDWPQSLASYAASSADPAARSRALADDRAVSYDHVEYAGPSGAVLIVDVVRFADASGAQAYDRYVNRAVCEQFGGTAGPAPTEVRMTRGSYEFVRWVSGDTMYDVSRAAVTPRATAADTEGLAAALLSGAHPR